MQAIPQAALSVGAAAKVLDATNNQIHQLPDSISQLSNLQRLVLAANQLETLPAAIGQLRLLKVAALCVTDCTLLPHSTLSPAATQLLHFLALTVAEATFMLTHTDCATIRRCLCWTPTSLQ